MTSKENQASTDFSALALSPATLANLQQLGYTQMTPIQAASLPPALLGKDLIAQASTGSGKTAAFALALLANLNPRRFAVQALVLCPTRELADQVTSEIRRLARAEENIKVVTLCGGVPLRAQTLSLEHGAHIVVGTPGRVMDHLERQHLSLEALNTLVLDEADRMLDMGFFDDIVVVAKQCPKERQTLLFSATYPEGIAKLSAQFMKTPVQITVQAQHAEGKIEQRWYEVKNSERLHAVSQLLNHFRPGSSIAFCNTKQQCRDLVGVLQAQGFSALALYGELEQRERDQVVQETAHEGIYRGADEYAAIQAVAQAGVPMVLSVYLDRPAILTEVAPAAQVLLANFGALDQALFDVISGKAKASGKLPFELPSSWQAVQNQHPDVAKDSANPLYPYGAGLAY